MRRRLTVALVAIAMMTVALPTGLAGHFSAGGTLAPGTGADETPDDPSVPGPIEGQETPYEVGIRDDCYDPEANATVDEAQEAAATHGFCGHLSYNDDLDLENNPFEQDSPIDQDLRTVGGLTIGTFDAQRTYWVGALGFGTCLPFCEDSFDDNMVQNRSWNIVHDNGAELGLTRTGEEANETHDDRFSSYGVGLRPAHAGGIAQRSTDAWEMNGWSIPFYLEDWVAFIEDGQGNFVTPSDIQDAVETAKQDGQLASDTTAKVCGYSPDYSYVATGEQTMCHIPMGYNGPSEDREEGPPFSGDEPCHSPGYVCGPTNGGAFWDAGFICVAGCYGGGEQIDYITFHWVIAPNEPDCGVIDPAFDLDGDSANNPYIAHDVDVQTPINALATGPTVAQDHALDYGFEFADVATDQLPGLPDVTDTEEVYDFARDNTTVASPDVLEPNHVDADGTPAAIDIDDNSRQAINEERTVGELSPCEELTTDETEQTIDPWVNYLENGVETNRGTSVYSGVTGVDEDPPNAGLYEGSEDADNDQTTDLYSTAGFVGMFTDKNDDGDYDRLTGFSDSDDGFGQSVYQKDSIEQVGAYPMMWDMRVTYEGGELVPNEGSGCNFVAGDTVTAMAEAGYGPNTGLAQAIYLKEPTAFTDGSLLDPQVIPYPGGNNIYVLGSQAVRELWDGDVTAANGTAIDAKVDDLVTELEDYALDELGADATTLNVHQPGAELELNSDYFSMCGESTGGYDAQLSFTHTCEVDCSGDTIATMYTFEVTSVDGTIGTGDEIPTFETSDGAYDFGTGGTWFDIDAFDGNADRVDQRMDPPPSED